MNILLVSPTSEAGIFNQAFMSPALGPMRIAGFLRAKGFTAEYYDPNLVFSTGDGSSLKEKILEREWDIIGFSVLEETLINDLRNMHMVRELRPNALIVAGGMEAQFNYQTILDKSPCQIVILGEGEIPMLMIAQGKPYHKIPGIVFRNKAVPLSAEVFNEASAAVEWENVPYEKYWDFYVRKYGETITPQSEQEIHTVRIFSRNRCPIGCKYCSSTFQLTQASGLKVPVISASSDTVLSLVDRIVAAHPRVRTIYLTDDDFCINKLDVIRFCKKVVERNYQNLSFLCFARATDIAEDMLEWMKRANFRRINVGVESFSEKVLEEVGKRCRIDQVHRGLQLAKKVGVKVYMNIILVTPESTLDDIDITATEAMRYLEDGFYDVGVITAIRPLKGTVFHEDYCDYLSEVKRIEGTDHKIKVDEMIWATDPLVRQVQKIYHANIKNGIEAYVQRKGIRHATNTRTAIASLTYMKRLIEMARRGEIEPFSAQETAVDASSASRRAIGTVM